MSAWLLYALIAPFLFGVLSMFDKFLRDKHLGTFTFSTFTGLSWFWVLLLIPLVGFPQVTWPVAVVGIASGVFFFGNGLPYFEALSIEEASRIVPLWSLSSVMTLLLAFIFLNERLTVFDYAGFVLVIAGAFLVTARHVSEVFRPRRAFWLMVIATASNAISLVLMKWVFDAGTPFWHTQILAGIGLGVATLAVLLFSGKVKRFAKDLAALKNKMAILLIREGISIISVLTSYFALRLGPASLTAALGDTVSAYTFVMAILLSTWLPRIVKEETDKKTLLTKAAAIGLIMVGLYFISL